MTVESGAQPARPTNDVDVVTNEVSVVSSYELEHKLEALGFRHSTKKSHPTCRWVAEGSPHFVCG